jgi:hypothetical protein
MNKHTLRSQLKTSGVAYICWFIIGCHYAYLGKWGIQILFWVTLGGLGIWALIDLFTMPGKVARHNAPINDKLDKIDMQERMEMIAAVKS